MSRAPAPIIFFHIDVSGQAIGDPNIVPGTTMCHGDEVSDVASGR